MRMVLYLMGGLACSFLMISGLLVALGIHDSVAGWFYLMTAILVTMVLSYLICKLDQIDQRTEKDSHEKHRPR